MAEADANAAKEKARWTPDVVKAANEAMALTGHRSVQTALRYHHMGSVQHTRAANLLQGSTSNEPGTE